MPHIKICGLTNYADAALAIQLGATYLGLNFFADSPRYLNLDDAEKLAREIKTNYPKVKLVGVFVDELPEQIKKTAEIARLDILQLHGDETPEFCNNFNLPIWKAFRVRDENSLEDLQPFLNLSGIVLDAYKKGSFGGTGQTFDWKLIHHVRDQLPFFILSGGLNPANILKAIEQLKPNVIDICSGVETAENPRQKSPEKLHALFEAIANAG
jgi:phosphoribosylanthranilate isomerase